MAAGPDDDSTARSAELVGVVVVDHGSRRAGSNTAFEQFVRDGAGRLPYPVVEPAHLELGEPSIGTAFDRCVARGATTVAVAPWFLGPGTHWDRDIPARASEAATRHPGVRWLVTAPLGPDPALLDLMGQRVDRCLGHAAGRGPDCEACAGSGRCVLR